MKQIILSIAVLLLMIQSFSQTTALTKEDYLQKSKNQHTAGWVLLGGGVTLSALGIIMISNSTASYFSFSDSYNYSNDKSSTAGVLGIAGIGAMFGSIPFFISSSKNARKAATISFNNQKILLLQQNSFVVNAQPTVTLKIRL